MSESSESPKSLGFDLRTRIAAVLLPGYTYDPSEHPDEWSARMADAVIIELGLRQELRYPNRLPHYTFMPPQRTRYVTGWELKP